MKKRIIIGTLIVFAAVALVVGFSGCELTLVLFSDIDGKVVNAKATGSSSTWWTDGTYSTYGLEVALYPENSTGTGFSSTAADTDTVYSTGWYELGNVSPGRYKLTGTSASSNDGWIFVPRIVTLSGSGSVLPPLIAYPNPGGVHNTDVLLFVSWENTDHDLDALLTYSSNGLAFDGSNRNILSVSSPSGDTSNLLFERDVTASTSTSIPRVETILVKDFSYVGSQNDQDFTALSDPPPNQLRYYVNCANTATSGISLTGSETEASAWGQVDIMRGAEHFGSWELPYNTAEDTLWVLNVDAIDDEAGNVDYWWIYSAGNANYNYKSFDDSFSNGIAIPVAEVK